MMNRINTALDNLPQSVTQVLEKSVLFPYSFLPAEIVMKLCTVTNQTQSEFGLTLLPLATAFAEAPVSNFYVGAVAFDSVGNAYLGANFEFANTHIGQTIHAEQSAIAHAWSRGAQELALLVINYAPCGHCRQFINEVNLCANFRILLPDTAPQRLSDYLPNAFGPVDLSIDARILGDLAHVETGNDLRQCAKAACQNSHAPYSHSNSGIALQYDDGDIVTGRYAENAAFNPSLPPLQMALNYRRLQGKVWHKIAQAQMIEMPSMLSQRDNVEALLQSQNATTEFAYGVISHH